MNEALLHTIGKENMNKKWREISKKEYEEATKKYIEKIKEDYSR